LYIILSRQFVITFHNEELTSLFEMQKRLDHLVNIELNSGLFFYVIIDRIIGTFNSLLYLKKTKQTTSNKNKNKNKIKMTMFLL